MRVYVISLQESVARRTAIGQRLGELGVDYELYPGVEGRAGCTSFEDWDPWQYWLNTGRSPCDGEFGCYASHLSLWQRCASSGQPLVVMEDDAAPLPHFPAALEVAGQLIERYGFLRLEYDGPRKPARTRKIESVGGFAVHYFLKLPFGAMCYAVSPTVARAFIAGSRVLRAPVDQFIKLSWEHRQPLYGLLPYSVQEGAFAADSTIRGRDRQAAAPSRRARRWLYKALATLQRGAFNRRWSQSVRDARRNSTGP